MKTHRGLIAASVFLLAFDLIAASGYGTGTTEVCPTEVTAWLSEQAIPLSTTDPQASLDDLEPLRELFGDARIVALGEQTHGTTEFFEMKHRLFRFLVEEMGFRVLVFEADWFSLQELNACLQPGGPPIEEAFQSLGYRVLQTNEVMALLRWIRSFNEAEPGDHPVQIAGADVLLRVDGVAAAVQDYLRRVDRTAADGFIRLLGRDFPHAWQYLRETFFSGVSAASPNPARVEQSLTVLDSVICWMEDNKDPCVAASSQAEYDLYFRALQLAAREMARIALLGEGVTSELDSRFSLERDRVMAENVTWWLEYLEETKTAIWAHNGHVAQGLSSTDVFRPMGQFLAETYGDDYLAVGSSFAEGSLTAWDGRVPRAYSAEPLIPGCYEAALQTTGLPRFVVDLRDLELGCAASEWMRTERGFRMIGSYYVPIDLGWDYPLILPESYDVIVHIQTSSAARQWGT